MAVIDPIFSSHPKWVFVGPLTRQARVELPRFLLLARGELSTCGNIYIDLQQHGSILERYRHLWGDRGQYPAAIQR